ncbi:MAG: methyl-accepting chemotaxis protein, partial [Bradyrhizobium sp.]|nr:methyl-accepting chemotaxis protein [Bradyrhizobium sp.]
MIKLNRIGYKLGLAGAVGVVLAVGMVANQLTLEWAVEAANGRADRSQRVIDAAISANLDGKQIELAARNIKLARTPGDVEKNVADLSRLKASETKALDEALASAQNPDARERLAKIKSLMGSYATGVDELAKTQLTLLAQIDKRSAISNEWTRQIDAELASPALAKLDNRAEIQKLLHQADAKVNALRAMVWRLGATGDTSLIAEIAKTQTALKTIFNLLRGEADDRELLTVISSLDKTVKAFVAANDEVVKIEELKADIVANRTIKFAEQAGALMDTQVEVARKNSHASKQEAAAETAQAGRISMAMAVVMVIALVASMVFTFLGISRPM